MRAVWLRPRRMAACEKTAMTCQGCPSLRALNLQQQQCLPAADLIQGSRAASYARVEAGPSSGQSPTLKLAAQVAGSGKGHSCRLLLSF